MRTMRGGPKGRTKMARRATKPVAKKVEIWVVQKEFSWQKREYGVGDEVTLDELVPGLQFNEELTTYYKASTFSYEIQHGMTMENGSSAPNMESKHVKLPIARK